MVEVLDALCDIQDVLDGTFLEFGLHGHKAPAMPEVHASNMSKLGADGGSVLREYGNMLRRKEFFCLNLVSLLQGK